MERLNPRLHTSGCVAATFGRGAAINGCIAATSGCIARIFGYIAATSGRTSSNIG